MTDAAALILAIDLGTSGPKVALVSTRGQVLALATGRTTLRMLPGGGAEQDPEEWWAAISATVQELLLATGTSAERIRAVAVTAQWAGTVAVDATGDALGNAIIWADARGAPYVHEITDGPLRFEGYGVDKLWAWLRRTGGIPTRGGKDSIAHVLFLKHAKPEVYAAAAAFLDIKDYLNLRLTGRIASSPDTMTLYWVTDNRRVDAIDYDPTLLRLAGLDRRQLPDLLPASSILGGLTDAAAGALGLRPATPVIVSSGDVMASAVGSGAVLDYAPHIHIGTSSWLSCHVPFKKTDLVHNMAALPAALPGKYLLTNEQDVAGGALVWLRDGLLYADDALAGSPPPDDIFARFDMLAAQSSPGSGGLLVTPWFNGERSPVEDRNLRAGIHNISLRTTRADIVRGTLEGVALNTRWLLKPVEAMVKRRLGAIRMVGGGAQSALWCQIYADVLDRPILQVEDAHACGARGAALLAALALGTLQVEEIPAAVQVAATYEPNPANRGVYDELFGEFVKLYTNNRAMYRRLNRMDGGSGTAANRLEDFPWQNETR